MMTNNRSPIAVLLFAVLVVLSLSGVSCKTLGSATLGGTLAKQSEQLAKQLEDGGFLVDDPLLTAYVQSVGDRLVEQAQSSPVEQFHFAVLDDDAPNAFAIPSGHVYISRGLLILMGSEDELAGVLGHEIGHVLEHHSAAQATGSIAMAPVRIVTRIGGGLVGLVLPTMGNVVVATGEVPAALSGASYGRSQENEADEVGQDLAARAGWDPVALSSVMDALAREEARQGHDPNERSWFSTHPASPDRAARIRSRAKSLARGDEAPIAGSQLIFLSKLDGLVVGPGVRHGIFVGSDFLHPVLKFGLRFPEGSPWRQVNTEQAVAVVRESPTAAIVLTIVAESHDALAVAQAFEPKNGKLDAAPGADSVNGLSTAHATGRDSGGWGRPAVRASARWIAYNGLVYRILSESTEAGYAELTQDFDSTERSFRPLTAADFANILEDRLRIERARAGETLADLLVRVGSGWDLQEAADANGIDSKAMLAAGAPVKVAMKERFIPAP